MGARGEGVRVPPTLELEASEAPGRTHSCSLLPPSPSPSVSLRTGRPRFSAVAHRATAEACSPARTHRSRSPRCDFHADSTSEMRRIRRFWAWLAFSQGV